MWWRSVEVAAAADDVWKLLVDIECWPAWGPTVTGARLDHPGTRIAAGSTGAVRTPLGVWLPFTITTYDDTSRTWSWSVAGVAATSHRVEATGPDHCRVGFGVPWWAPAYLAVVEVGLRRVRRAASG